MSEKMATWALEASEKLLRHVVGVDEDGLDPEKLKAIIAAAGPRPTRMEWKPGTRSAAVILYRNYAAACALNATSPS